MIRLNSASLLAIGRFLGTVCEESLFRTAAPPLELQVQGGGGFGRPPQIKAVRVRTDVMREELILAEDLTGYQHYFYQIQDHCQLLELRQSVKQMQRILSYVNSPQPRYGVLISLISELHNRFFDELQDKATFQIEAKKLDFYENPQAFGPDVFQKFPSANDDIFEASTLLAFDRGTACVIHLGRVVEIGLRALAQKLGLPQKPDWGKHLADIERELTSRYKGAGIRTADEIFFAEAAAQIGHIKTAWRNPSVHADKSYSPERALEIFQAVRCFMCHLASQIHEQTPQGLLGGGKF